METNDLYQLVSDGISIAMLLTVTVATLVRLHLDFKARDRSKPGDGES